jgi:hypothetical protein
VVRFLLILSSIHAHQSMPLIFDRALTHVSSPFNSFQVSLVLARSFARLHRTCGEGIDYRYAQTLTLLSALSPTLSLLDVEGLCGPSRCMLITTTTTITFCQSPYYRRVLTRREGLQRRALLNDATEAGSYQSYHRAMFSYVCAQRFGLSVWR